MSAVEFVFLVLGSGFVLALAVCATGQLTLPAPSGEAAEPAPEAAADREGGEQ